MRLRFLLTPICAVLLGSCAYQGTIVQKDATPSPFDISYGIDNSYAFLLRDNTGAVRRQIVTADVYNQYTVGDYFNDLQPQQPRGDGKTFDGKTVMTAMMSKVTNTRRTAAAKKAEPKRQIAKVSKPAATKKPAVKVAKQTRPTSKTQPATRVAIAAPIARRALPVDQPTQLEQRVLRQRRVWDNDNDLAYISVPRCR